MASSTERTRPANGALPPAGLSSWRWNLAALGIFLLVAAALYGEVWLAGPTTTVAQARAETPFGRLLSRMDVNLETWLVARNAHTLVRRPQRLFDTEHCAPGEKTMTLGIPMIAMGVVGIPASVLTGDPILTYNFALVGLSLLAAFAMYLLVADWTGVPPAGIVAGLLYSFNSIRMENIEYPSVVDTSWTVFALFFVHRLFARGRWRDAVGLSVAGAMQIAASFYPMLGAVFLLPPFMLWLVIRYRLRHVKLSQLAFVALAGGLAAAWVYGPYLAAKANSDILERTAFYFTPWRAYLPGGAFFAGWLSVALLVPGLALGRARAIPLLGGDPRWALVAGAFIVALMAAGPLYHSLLSPARGSSLASFNPYVLLSGVVPGLNSVRAVARLGADVHVALTIVAGMGAAALLRLCGPFARIAGPALIALAAFSVVRAPALGFERPYAWDLEMIRPSPAALEFFEVLEQKGSQGPIFEIPENKSLSVHADQPRRILLAAFHGRRTSACLASYRAPYADELIEIARGLPRDPAVRELAEMGFTTLLLHHPGDSSRIWRRRFVERSERPGAFLRLLHTSADMTAFEITATGTAQNPLEER